MNDGLMEEISKHDPTGSFSREEILSIMTIMDMPVTVWADAVRSGRADPKQLEEYIEKIEKIKPGYGHYLLGDMLKSEDEHLEGGLRRAVNWKKIGDKYVKFYGEPRTGMVEATPVTKTIEQVTSESADLRPVRQENLEVTSVEFGEPKTPEQLEAWKKFQDSKYEYMKAMMNEKPNGETTEA